jgi:hypothetical protein
MSHLRKKLERRTYSQDRYYILIKRQKAGKATFKELTELDEIVNRVPDIRDIVIRESFMAEEDDINLSQNDSGNSDSLSAKSAHPRNFWNRIRSFIIRAFTSQISDAKAGGLATLV